jgi:hypothetical protein
LPSTLNRLLIDSCMDVELLDRIRRAPDAALADEGVPAHLRPLFAGGRGSMLSSAALQDRPLPSAEQIRAEVNERVADDAVFREQVVREPVNAIQRLLGIALPLACTIEAVEVDGAVELRIDGLEPDAQEGLRHIAAMSESQVVEVVEDVVEVVEVEVIVATQKADVFATYWNGRMSSWRAEHETTAARR